MNILYDRDELTIINDLNCKGEKDKNLEETLETFKVLVPSKKTD